MKKTSQHLPDQERQKKPLLYAAHFLCTICIKEALCQHVSHQYREERPGRIAWQITFYEDYDLINRLLQEGKTPDQVGQYMWKHICQEQDHHGPICHAMVQVCSNCVTYLVSSHIEGNEALRQGLPTRLSLIGGQPLLFVTHRNTYVSEVIALPPRPSQQDILHALQGR